MGLLYGVGSRLNCFTESQFYTELHGLTVSYILTDFQRVTIAVANLMMVPAAYKLGTNQSLLLGNNTAKK